MKVYSNLESIEEIEPAALALGSFDGIHLGHRELIRRTVEEAKVRDLKSGIFTFSNHPRNVIKGDNSVKNIIYSQEKQEIIESLGVYYLFDIPFTQEIMKMTKTQYVEDLLVKKCNAKVVSCGFNHKFGYKAEGGTEDLRELGQTYDFDTIVMEPYLVNDNVVSSSLIRTLIASGRVDRCLEYLGRRYAIRGEVVVGNKLGRQLGFPTSNLVIDEAMVAPPNGVYVTYCIYNDKKYPSVTNVGVKPTVGDYKKNVETHIFDFDREIYGKTITVELLRKMRDEVKFDDYQELSDQIVRDCIEARKYHEKILDK